MADRHETPQTTRQFTDHAIGQYDRAANVLDAVLAAPRGCILLVPEILAAGFASIRTIDAFAPNTTPYSAAPLGAIILKEVYNFYKSDYHSQQQLSFYPSPLQDGANLRGIDITNHDDSSHMLVIYPPEPDASNTAQNNPEQLLPNWLELQAFVRGNETFTTVAVPTSLVPDIVTSIDIPELPLAEVIQQHTRLNTKAPHEDVRVFKRHEVLRPIINESECVSLPHGAIEPWLKEMFPSLARLAYQDRNSSLKTTHAVLREALRFQHERPFGAVQKAEYIDRSVYDLFTVEHLQQSEQLKIVRRNNEYIPVASYSVRTIVTSPHLLKQFPKEIQALCVLYETIRASKDTAPSSIDDQPASSDSPNTKTVAQDDAVHLNAPETRPYARSSARRLALFTHKAMLMVGLTSLASLGSDMIYDRMHNSPDNANGSTVVSPPASSAQQFTLGSLTEGTKPPTTTEWKLETVDVNHDGAGPEIRGYYSLDNGSRLAQSEAIPLTNWTYASDAYPYPTITAQSYIWEDTVDYIRVTHASDSVFTETFPKWRDTYGFTHRVPLPIRDGTRLGGIRVYKDGEPVDFATTDLDSAGVSLLYTKDLPDTLEYQLIEDRSSHAYANGSMEAPADIGRLWQELGVKNVLSDNPAEFEAQIKLAVHEHFTYSLHSQLTPNILRSQKPDDIIDAILEQDAILCNLSATLTTYLLQARASEVGAAAAYSYVPGFINYDEAATGGDDNAVLSADELHAWTTNGQGEIIDATPTSSNSRNIDYAYLAGIGLGGVGLLSGALALVQRRRLKLEIQMAENYVKLPAEWLADFKHLHNCLRYQSYSDSPFGITKTDIHLQRMNSTELRRRIAQDIPAGDEHLAMIAGISKKGDTPAQLIRARTVARHLQAAQARAALRKP